MGRPLQILDLVSREKLERIIQVFTEATGVASIMTYVDGHPITRPHNFTPFCLHYCRSTYRGKAMCYESDRRGGLESARMQQPYIYNCLNSGIIDCAVPVMVEGQHLATVLAGQVLEKPIDREAAVERARGIGVTDAEGYLEALSGVPLMPRERVLSIMNLMSEITQTISELALQKYLLQRRSQRYLTRLINSISDCIVSTNADSTISMVNQAGALMFGYQSDEMIGQPVVRLLADDASRSAYRNSVGLCQLSNWRAELSARRADGTVFPVQVSLSSVSDRNERNTGYVGVIRDVTEEKRLERMKEDLIGMITHDLRNPVLSLERALHLVVNGSLGPLNGEQRGVMQLALVTSQQLYGMVSDILDIYRNENGKFVLRRTAVAVRQILAESVSQVDFLAGEKHVAIQGDFSQPVGAVHADRSRLLRVCVNLLENSIKYSPEGGNIKVGVDRVGEALKDSPMEAFGADRALPDRVSKEVYFLFTVEDEGPGIPSGFHHSIFEKYFTVESKTEPGETGRKEGVGLGLAFCKQVVEAHGGRIWVESPIKNDAEDSRRGARFRFFLPALQ